MRQLGRNVKAEILEMWEKVKLIQHLIQSGRNVRCSDPDLRNGLGPWKQDFSFPYPAATSTLVPQSRHQIKVDLCSLSVDSLNK